MKTLEAGGKIYKGKLVIHNPDVFDQAIADIGFVSHAHLTVEYGNKRTVPQNSYLYGAIVTPIKTRLAQDGWNYSAHECYKFIEGRFCKFEKVNETTGEVMDYIKPIKELTTDQWDEVIMGDVRGWAQRDLGIYCKLPHEYFGMPEQIYNDWKLGNITKKQAIELAEEQNNEHD